MSKPIRVLIWNEYRHEIHKPNVAAIYPDGMHKVISRFLEEQDDITTATATLDEPEHGLTQEALENCDVLIWWGHTAHKEVRDEIVERVRQRVLSGMGLIVLHSGHASKIFHALMGTNTLQLRWRETGDLERLWVMDPTHPIAQGVGEYFELEHEETYGEHFDIPTPDEIVFMSWFSGGEIFRSGCCFKRGAGKIFYFRPGHETFPIYYDKNVQRVLINAVRWAAPLMQVPATVVSGHCPVSPQEMRKHE